MRIKGQVRLKDEVLHTKNLFGSIEDIAGRFLDVIERSSDGHCLCVFKDPGGRPQYLVDVHRKDTLFFDEDKNIDIMDMVREIMRRAGESDKTDSGN